MPIHKRTDEKEQRKMNGHEKAAIITASVVAGAALVAAGVYLGCKYIPIAAEEARHRARMFELDHRAQFTAANKAVAAAKDKVVGAIPRKK